MIAGIFLFVGPFAFFTKAIYALMGNPAVPDLHTLCLRMPIDWLVAGRFSSLVGYTAAYLVLGIVIIALIAGPLFCGWLCPIGAVSEGVSRIIPIPEKYKVRIKDPKITRGLRYGFLVGFISVAAIVGYKLTAGFASICCRYCPTTIVQNFSNALTINPAALDYWQSGTILALGSWLFIGGVLFSGGRGWCLFFCPVGAISGITHTIGAKLGLYKVKFNADSCKSCANCSVKCPVWAQDEEGGVEQSLCITCRECTHSCRGGAYTYTRGKENA